MTDSINPDTTDWHIEEAIKLHGRKPTPWKIEDVRKLPGTWQLIAGTANYLSSKGIEPPMSPPAIAPVPAYRTSPSVVEIGQQIPDLTDEQFASMVHGIKDRYPNTMAYLADKEIATEQAAASRCADLANAEVGSKHYRPSEYIGDSMMHRAADIAFRRHVERTDAMIREVLVKLADLENLSPMDAIRVGWVEDLLRADLLPDPQPRTLLEQFKAECADMISDWSEAEGNCVEAFADWIAKREGNHP